MASTTASQNESPDTRQLEWRKAASLLVKFLSLPPDAVDGLLARQKNLPGVTPPEKKLIYKDVYIPGTWEGFPTKEEYILVPDGISGARYLERFVDSESVDPQTLVLDEEYWQYDRGRSESVASSLPKSNIPESLGFFLDLFRGVSKDKRRFRDPRISHGLVFLYKDIENVDKTRNTLVLGLDVRVPDTGYTTRSFLVYLSSESQQTAATAEHHDREDPVDFPNVPFHTKLVIESIPWSDLMLFLDLRKTEETRNLTFDATLLYGMCGFGKLDRLMEELKDDENRYICDQQRKEFIEMAVKMGHTEILEHLLLADPDLGITDLSGNIGPWSGTTFGTALNYGNFEAAQILYRRDNRSYELKEEHILRIIFREVIDKKRRSEAIRQVWRELCLIELEPAGSDDPGALLTLTCDDLKSAAKLTLLGANVDMKDVDLRESLYDSEGERQTKRRRII